MCFTLQPEIYYSGNKNETDVNEPNKFNWESIRHEGLKVPDCGDKYSISHLFIENINLKYEWLYGLQRCNIRIAIMKRTAT